MRIEAAWLLLLVAACDGGGTGGKGDDTVDDTDPVETDGDDTDVAGDTDAPIEPTVSGSLGNIVILHSNQGRGDPPRTKVRGLFVQDMVDVVSPAAGAFTRSRSFLVPRTTSIG